MTPLLTLLQTKVNYTVLRNGIAVHSKDIFTQTPACKCCFGLSACARTFANCTYVRTYVRARARTHVRKLDQKIINLLCACVARGLIKLWMQLRRSEC